MNIAARNRGDGADELITWYKGSGTTDRRWAVADERGSVVAYTDTANAAIAINRYDEYGIPQSTNLGRFQYTGQAWLAEIGMYYYKARIYSPTLGRFLQTDPIGYGDGMNMYAYVANDPVNKLDPLGLCGTYEQFQRDGTLMCGTNTDFAGGAFFFGLGGGIFSGGGGSASNEAPQKDDFHYKVVDFAFCSANDLFAQFSKSGNSAPGAPAAQPGTTPDITLTGGNQITQVVDPGARTITNITQEGHRYHSGTVEIRVTPTWYRATVSILGRGSAPRFWENSILGASLFTALSTRATVACTVGAK